MDSESDEDDSVSNPFLVPDSQVPIEAQKDDGSGRIRSTAVIEPDTHSAVLKELEISKLPETPAHLQGKEEKIGKSTKESDFEEVVKQLPSSIVTTKPKPAPEEEELSEVIPSKDDLLRPTSLNISNESGSSRVSTVSYKSPLSSPDMVPATLPENQANPDKQPELEKTGSVSSSITDASLELNRGAADLFSGSSASTSASKEGVSPSSRPSLDLSKISNMYQKSLSSSGDKSSYSSLYPSTSASSHLSQDTPSMPSSPEFRVPQKAPLSKFHSSSSGASSSEDTKGTSRKKKKLDIIKEQEAAEDVSMQELSPDEQGFQSGLSSKEVTHLETPPLRSTPNETSFECLHLSGEPRNPTVSVYSLPDPLPSSPSVMLSGADLEGSISLEETSKIKEKDSEKSIGEKARLRTALPKWVTEAKEREKLEFESSSDSDPITSQFSDASKYQPSSVASSTHFDSRTDSNQLEDGIKSVEKERSIGSVSSSKSLELQPSQMSDMEIEMSQDLFNPPLTVTESASLHPRDISNDFQIQTQSSSHEPSDMVLDDREQELNLFLSQTQNESTPVTEMDSMKSAGLYSGDVKSSNSPRSESPRATPSQSIIPVKVVASSGLTQDSTIEDTKALTEQLKMPKDVFARLIRGSSESASSNQFHLSLPPEGKSFHPVQTLTPPSRSMEFQGELSQEILSKIEEKGEKSSQKESEGNNKLANMEVGGNDEKFQVTKLPGFPPIQEEEDKPSIDVEEEQSETIYAKALRISKSVHKKETLSEATEHDPFAFNSQDEPPSKRRRTTATQEDHRVATFQRSSSEESEAFCRAEMQITTEEIRTIRRRFVTKFYSFKNDRLLKTTEFVETGEPETVSITSESPRVDLVSTRSLISSDEENKGKRTPKKQYIESCRRTSPRFKVTSSSTSPDDIAGKHKRHLPRTSTPSSNKIESKKTISKDHLTTGATKESVPGTSNYSATLAPLQTDKSVLLDKSEYEKLLELAFAEEHATKRKTRSSKQDSKMKDGDEIIIGARVFAKWVDHCYYPGKIKEKSGLDRYKVEFHDGKELVLPVSSIVMKDKVSVGQSLYVLDSDEECYNLGSISAIRSQKDVEGAQYEVKLNHNGTTKVCRSNDVMLNIQQISELKETEETTKTFLALNEVNEMVAPLDKPSVGMAAVKGRRSKSIKPAGNLVQKIEKNNTTEVEGESKENPEIKKHGRKSKKKFTASKELKQNRERELSLMMGKSSTSPEEEQSARLPPKRKKKEHSSANDFTTIMTPKKGRKDPIKRNEDRLKKIEFLKKKQNDQEFVRIYGRLPQNETLFHGYKFLITHVPKKEQLEADEALSYEGFHRSYLGCQIVAGGGFVVDNLQQLDDAPKDKIILIAPTSQKTLKYYFALSYGIPCLSHAWIAQCCEENRQVERNGHVLEAGIDQLNGLIVESHKRIQPLKGRKIYIQVIKEEREELTAAVRHSGAEVLNALPKKRLEDMATAPCDYILVGDNASVRKPVMSSAKYFGIQCVTVKWFYQCLIHGELINPEESSLFRYP